MLLFSVHPEPEGRKVDKMLTLKKVKELVKAPVHTKRVPSPKVLLEEGRIFLRKEFEHDSHLTLYHSGYAKHQDKGYTANLVFRLHRSDGSAVEKLHTAWTHKGRKFLYHELKRRGILPMAEQEG